MIKDPIESYVDKKNAAAVHLRVTGREFYIHYPIDKILHTKAFGTSAVVSSVNGNKLYEPNILVSGVTVAL